MRVFVTGATGFVGHEVIRQLLAAGHRPVCLVRPGSEGKLPPAVDEIREGDVTRPESLRGALAGCEAVVHLVGIIREYPRQKVTFDRLHRQATAHMLSAAKAQKVQRFVLMSSNGAEAEGSTAYYRSKWKAEQLLKASSLDWTIFRPSVMYGAEDNFCTLLASMVRILPVVPVFGDGCYRIAPVAVQDVAATIVASLARPDACGRSFACCGDQMVTFDELLDIIGGVLRRRNVVKVHQPLWLVKPLLARLQSLPGCPLTVEQLQMLLHGNVCDPQPWKTFFGLSNRSLADGLKRALGR
ncbi:NAD-dependent nucleoside diphosphate-sugar epimerase/dehydratase [Syntrophotalea carbinolica DSM 2380]|uniref:NAD-dependent nucleoside diphosphate-sugar epimerase/dehydratase n=1 Tax=Syntrophotalea carbinolica (strain DSM 2380 / NBRC 103641 / GraBd1) TaxID=338963 RepID=Q3A8K9_SYNC1|nr:NAD(P)H-binding protein [Syntrophotalea carbinolica]ABA87283.1 NAD-dependent nucleoside diphosphate-sugar epimerase/dehydratase [Syntrophotalea carbinolica DSM 2380]